MSDLSRRDIIKQGLGAFLAPKSAIKAVNSALKTIPNNSKVDLKRYGIDLASLMGAVLDGDENENFEIGADRSITLSNGREIPAETVAAIIKDGLKGLSLEELIEYMTSYMGSADYDDEFGVFSDIVKQAVDKVGFRTFIRAVIAADNYGVNSTPSIENSKLEKLQDLVVNITRFDVLPGSDNIIFGGGGSYTDQLDDLVNLLRKQGVIKPVEAAKMLRNQKADIDRLDAAQREWQTKQSHDTQQSEPDWYNDNWRDPFYKSKERFHEHHIKRLKFFTEAYSSLYKSVIKEQIQLQPYTDQDNDNYHAYNDIASKLINVEDELLRKIKNNLGKLIQYRDIYEYVSGFINEIDEDINYKQISNAIDGLLKQLGDKSVLYTSFVEAWQVPEKLKPSLRLIFRTIRAKANQHIVNLNLPSHRSLSIQEALNPQQVIDRAGFVKSDGDKNIWYMHSLARLNNMLQVIDYIFKNVYYYYYLMIESYNHMLKSLKLKKDSKIFKTSNFIEEVSKSIRDVIASYWPGPTQGGWHRVRLYGLILAFPERLRSHLKDNYDDFIEIFTEQLIHSGFGNAELIAKAIINNNINIIPEGWPL